MSIKERELLDDRDPEKNILRIEIRERTLRERESEQRITYCFSFVLRRACKEPLIH